MLQDQHLAKEGNDQLADIDKTRKFSVSKKADVIKSSALSLVINLEEQLNLHQHLKLVLTKELDLSADCQLSDLETIQQRKIEIANKLYDIETKRKKIVDEVALLLSFNPQPSESESITLAQLIPFFPSEEAKKLTAIKLELKQLMDEIQPLAKQTANVAKARLISLRSTTSQLDKWMVHHTFYSKFGNLTNNAHSRLLSRHI